MKEDNKIIFARTAITPVLKGLLPTDFVNVSGNLLLLSALRLKIKNYQKTKIHQYSKVLLNISTTDSKVKSALHSMKNSTKRKSFYVNDL